MFVFSIGINSCGILPQQYYVGRQNFTYNTVVFKATQVMGSIFHRITLARLV